jgi:hypothetical protein
LEDWKLLVVGVVMAVVAVTIVIDRRRQRRHVPLAARFATGPTPQPLGMEATDLPGVQGILDRNAALARKTGRHGGAASWTEAGAIPPAPAPRTMTLARPAERARTKKGNE